MNFAENCWLVFEKATLDYHIDDVIDKEPPIGQNDLPELLYLKNWIDNIQWHWEDKIRDLMIEPEEALRIKRRIDALNQYRTDTVERIDDYLLEEYGKNPLPDAKLNTESPAWAIDRLSILYLKLYHIEESLRDETLDERVTAKTKIRHDILLMQKKDMYLSINELMDDVIKGEKKYTLYRQVKLYNDPDFNSFLKEKTTTNIQGH